MKQHRILVLCVGALASVSVRAQTTTPPAPSTTTTTMTPPASGTAAAAPAAAPAAPAAPAGPTAMTTPSMSGPLAANGNPYHFTAGPLGTWYLTGAISGLGFIQDQHIPGDNSGQVDLDNAQIFLQKTDGVMQGFVQAGWYSLPDLGAGYITSSHIWDDTFGPIPQAFVKIVPNGSFSVEAGKLPTLIGDEYTFSYENMNIFRGLLWNQQVFMDLRVAGLDDRQRGHAGPGRRGEHGHQPHEFVRDPDPAEQRGDL
jgi:hypothetical protein